MNALPIPPTLRWQVRQARLAVRLALGKVASFDLGECVRVPEGLVSPPSPRALRMMRAAQAGSA